MPAEPFVLGSVIELLRNNAPSFERRVGGTASLAAQGHEDADIPVPHAFVVPLHDTAAARSDLGVAQLVSERFAVIVAVDNSRNRSAGQGLAASDELRVLRAEVFEALLGKELAGWYDTVAYVGGRHLTMTTARLYHQFEFNVSYYIAPAGTGGRGRDNQDPNNPLPAVAIHEVYARKGLRDTDVLGQPSPEQERPPTQPSPDTLAATPERIL